MGRFVIDLGFGSLWDFGCGITCTQGYAHHLYPITESTITAVPIFHHDEVPIKVNKHYDDTFEWYLCCLLLK